MLKDITIGQYYNTTSPIHSLDPRTKLVWLLMYMVALFVVKSPLEYALIAILTFILVKLSRVPVKFILRGLKPIAMLIGVTAVLNLFMTTGGTILFQFGIIHIYSNGVSVAVAMMVRILLLVIGSSLLTLTTSPTVLTSGIESLMSPLTKIGVPSHEIAMMMSIALRFIPTLADETEKIMKAQVSRGSDFDDTNIIKKIKSMTPLFVPLFISAFRRADDLAMAMETRCYSPGIKRTSYRVLKYKRIDAIAFISALLIASAIATMRILGV